MNTRYGCGDRTWTCDLRVMSSKEVVFYRFVMCYKVLILCCFRSVIVSYRFIVFSWIFHRSWIIVEFSVELFLIKKSGQSVKSSTVFFLFVENVNICQHIYFWISTFFNIYIFWISSFMRLFPYYIWKNIRFYQVVILFYICPVFFFYSGENLFFYSGEVFKIFLASFSLRSLFYGLQKLQILTASAPLQVNFSRLPLGFVLDFLSSSILFFSGFARASFSQFAHS